MKSNKKKHRILTFLLAFVVLTGLATVMPVSANDNEGFYRDAARLVQENWNDGYIDRIVLRVGEPDMAVDGVIREIDPGRGTRPVIVQGRTLLPIRALVEETGGEIYYDALHKKVTIYEDESIIEMHINANTMIVNGNSVEIEVAPIIENGRTMLPIRAVTENLGYEVEWQGDTRDIILTREFQTKRLIVKTTGSNINLSDLGADSLLDGPDNISVLQFDSIEAAQEAYDRLEGLSQVVYVEPDIYIPPIADMTVSLGTASSGYYRSWGVEKIGADKYADYLVKSGKTQMITVAVLDTGVDSGHPFLAGRVLNDGHNFVNGNANTYDRHGHGTHVAGTIVDCTPNLNNVKILPIKVLGDDGKGTHLTVANGVRYSTDKSANVINMSLRGGHSFYTDDAVEYAISKNVTVVVGAGNDSIDTNNYCPAHIREAITVAAVDSNDRPASFTNYGSAVDIAAPGVSINSSVPGGGYATWSGTSMATPHVAAAAAMYILDNPALEPVAVQTLVKQNSITPSDWNSRYGAGIINIEIDMPVPPEDPVTPPEGPITPPEDPTTPPEDPALPPGGITYWEAFPDANFRDYVLKNVIGGGNAASDVISDADKTKMAGVTSLYVNKRGISDLTGIGYFTALTDLGCFNNNLTVLDVSKNIRLRQLSCYDNNLTMLDLSKNTALIGLLCHRNNLTALEVSKNTKLMLFACDDNNLTTLDISKNTALEYFSCYGNNLTTLNISKNTALTNISCNKNNLLTLDVSKNTVLKYLNCSDNNLTTLDVSKNIAMTELLCHNNNLRTLDVSKNTELTLLGCSNINLTALDVSKNTALTYLDCSRNNLIALDVSKNIALTRIQYDPDVKVIGWPR